MRPVELSIRLTLVHYTQTVMTVLHVASLVITD
jgi:hypothetical protein